MKKLRALWLMNHRTLRDFEVPLLIDMGLEVYCPKIFPYDEGNLSADINYCYDNTLSIDKQDLNILNQVNFYKQVPENILMLINELFDIAFFGFFPEQLKMLVEGFKGILIMQPFGLANKVTYTDIITESLGISFLDKIEKLGNRFFFAQAYKNIAEIECSLLKRRSVYLPIGLKNAKVINDWIGGDNRILFVCPRINTSPYFNHIYHEFKKNLGDFDYVIGGSQPIKVLTDHKVLGYIPQEKYEYNMTHLSVMFYHSQEQRHLHYHPLEAIKHGMPLIYMSGGMLDNLAGKKLLGSCNTIKEARNKIKKIYSGNKKFIEQIRKEQSVLLHDFTYEYCKKIWDFELTPILQRIETTGKKDISKNEKKLAVLLPAPYTGGVLDYTIRFILSLQRGALEDNQQLKIIFGYIDHENFKNEEQFERLKENGIQIRKFKWKMVDNNYLNNVIYLKGYFKKHSEKQYCLADDNGDFFEDCDYLILSIDRVPVHFFTTKPYIVVVHDYIQRYMPEQYGDFYEKCVIDLQREAEGVIVMTPPTLEDGIQYAGIKKDKIYLTPLMFDEIKDDSQSKPIITDEYFLWSTNIGRHKNHLIALNALSKYYDKGGKFKCVVTGVDTNKFSVKNKDVSNSYVNEVREQIKKDKNLEENILFCGNLSKKNYLNILKNAKFFMHPGFTDNGNMTAIDAAFLNVPTITSDYPAMRYYEDYMHLNMRFFNPFDSNQLADLLLEMENSYIQCKNELPSIEQLKTYTIKSTYKELYNTVRNILKF